MNLSDYAQALGAAQQLVPSYDQLLTNNLARKQATIQNRVLEQDAIAAEAKNEQQQRFMADIATLGDNATPDAYRGFAMRYPTIAKPLIDAAGAMETNQRQQVVRDTAQIRATIAAGKPEIGAQLVQRHIDANIAAGKEADPEDQALLSMLKSGDPTQLKAASGMLYATLASFDPDSAAKNVGEYASPTDDKRYVVGRALVDQQGNALYRDPEPAQYRAVGEGQTLVEVGGGDPVSGSAGSAGGGSGAPRNVRNNNPGNIIDSAFARSQPGYVGSDGRFARFADPAAGQAAQGALLASYIDRGFNTVGKIINRWAPPSENDTGRYVATVARELGVKPGDVLDKSRIPELQRAITRVEGGPGSSSAGQAGGVASGGARIVAQGAPKRGYEVLSSQEVASIPGLDPQRTYQRSPDGQITAVGGSDRGSLKPWPAGALDARTTNNATLTNIDGAIRLLDPKNNSREARTARAAIGPGTGFLGDTFTQWNNPEGTDARSRIGQIGGLIVKDTSGAAVSASEDQRLAKWVPMVTDKPSVALAKLRNLRREVTQRNRAIEETYSEDQGYRPFRSQQPAAGGFRILRSRPK